MLPDSLCPVPGPRTPMRRELSAARRALGARERIAAAERLAGRLDALPALSAPGRVAGYWAVDGEIPLHAVIAALPDETTFCLPVLGDEGRLRFAPWRPGEPLAENRFGIPEPASPHADCFAGDALDLVLAPLVGFDRLGHRLGTGGGWYDRSFAFRLRSPAPPLLVGVGYALQEVEALQPAPWDVPMDLVATDAELIDCRPTAARGPG